MRTFDQWVSALDIVHAVNPQELRAQRAMTFLIGLLSPAVLDQGVTVDREGNFRTVIGGVMLPIRHTDLGAVESGASGEAVFVSRFEIGEEILAHGNA